VPFGSFPDNLGLQHDGIQSFGFGFTQKLFVSDAVINSNTHPFGFLLKRYSLIGGLQNRHETVYSDQFCHNLVGLLSAF
jgi:hypothetical protein